MKNNRKILLSLFTAFILNLTGCYEEQPETETRYAQVEDEIALVEKHKTGNPSDASRSTLAQTQAGCGAYFSGSRNSGSYTYPDETITLPCATAGGTISIICKAFDVPNRFSVYSNGQLVVSSGWMGYSSNPGPWGNFALNGPSVKTLSIPKTTATTYLLRVETSGGAIPDGWDATVGCTDVCPIVVPPACESSCAKSETGTYPGPITHYTYPDRNLSFCSAQDGKTISIQCNAYDVPNKVSVYDNLGALVATTGWFGYSVNPGPWGPYSINGPGVKVISFTKSSSTSTYKLRVETALTVGTLPDGWEAKISCL
jgi:hypothetical protein